MMRLGPKTPPRTILAVPAQTPFGPFGPFRWENSKSAEIVRAHFDPYGKGEQKNFYNNFDTPKGPPRLGPKILAPTSMAADQTGPAGLTRPHFFTPLPIELAQKFRRELDACEISHVWTRFGVSASLYGRETAQRRLKFF